METVDRCASECFRPLDSDGDAHVASWCDGDDCNDLNAPAYPGAPEVFDGVDNDRDGLTDEGAGARYLDQDGDGHGDARFVFAGCPRSGLVTAGDDCDDWAPEVHPGASEVCDHRDDDCDGELGAGENDDGRFGSSQVINFPFVISI